MIFVLAVYQLAREFPGHEAYGLTSQFRRAAVSIPANIAEGFCRRSNKDKLRYYNIARGSIEECRYYLILANDLGYADTTSMNNMICEVSKMLEGYSRSILRSES